MKLNLPQQDLEQIVRTTWESVLGWDPQLMPRSEFPRDQAGSKAGLIRIAGAEEGAIVCLFSEALIRRATAVIFDMNPAAVTPDFLHDALGELTNILGGNIKGLLAGPTRLSLPAVLEGWEVTADLPASVPLAEAAFRIQGEPFLVQLLPTP